MNAIEWDSNSIFSPSQTRQYKSGDTGNVTNFHNGSLQSLGSAYLFLFCIFFHPNPWKHLEWLPPPLRPPKKRKLKEKRIVSRPFFVLVCLLVLLTCAEIHAPPLSAAVCLHVLERLRSTQRPTIDPALHSPINFLLVVTADFFVLRKGLDLIKKNSSIQNRGENSKRSVSSVIHCRTLRNIGSTWCDSVKSNEIIRVMTDPILLSIRVVFAIIHFL